MDFRKVLGTISSGSGAPTALRFRNILSIFGDNLGRKAMGGMGGVGRFVNFEGIFSSYGF